MIRRSAWILFELVGALLAGAAIAVGLLAWRLSAGPIALEFMTPYIEEALSSGGDARVRIARTAITWQGWRSNPELSAEDVRVTSAEGKLLATVPALALTLSLDSLLRGSLAPARIEVVRPRLHLVRTAEGAITVDIGEGSDGDLAGRSMADLAGPMRRDGALGQIRRIGVRDAVIVIDDRALGQTWRVPDGDFVFNRSDDGLDGTLALLVDLGGAPFRLDGSFVHRRTSGLTDATVRFAVPEPAILARLAPELAPLADVAVAMKGEARVAFTLPDSIESASIAIEAGPGRIAHPALAGGQIQIAGAAGHARWEPAARRVALEDLWVDLGGPRFTFAGAVDGLGGPMRIALDTSFHDVPTQLLWQLWPPPVAPGGRRWTTANVSEGAIREAQAKIVLTLADWDAPVVAERVEGVFSYYGLTANYMNGLPPVRQISGTARFDENQMVLETNAGSLLRATRVPRATIRITDFQKKDQQIAIDVRSSGPITEALEVLDRPRLGFMTRFGIKPAEVGGDATIDLSFAFPAIDAIRIEDVRIRGRAEARNVSAPAGIEGWRLTEADLTATVDKDALEVSGRGKLHGAAVAVTWRETFVPRGGVQSQYTLKGRIDDAARTRFGYDTAPWLTGPADVDVSLTQRADKRSELVIRADLTPAAMAIAPVGWRKAPGVRASTSFSVDFAGPRMAAIRAIRASAPGLAVEGALATGGDAWTLDLTRFVIGETTLAARIRPRGAGYAITIGGPQLDARPLFEGPVGKTPAPAQSDDPPLAIEARFDKVLLDAGRALERVTATIERDHGTTRNLRLDATVPGGGGTVNVAIAPSGPGTRRLTARASDAGTILAAFASLDNIRGGTIDLQGTITERGGKDTVAGNVVVRNYRQIRAPMLAQMLSILSLPTITSLLQGEGIPFAEASTDFTWLDGKVTLRNARAYGGALGFTAEGTIDVRSETLDLEGTLVPAYTINNLLGNIPILGTILAGGKDEGVFAANYRIAGPFADPRISVNVLSALAPGILRKMFGFLEAGDPMRAPSGQPGFRQDGPRPGN